MTNRLAAALRRAPGGAALIALFCLALVAAVWAVALDRARHERAEAAAEEHKRNANLALAFEQHTLNTLRTVERTMRYLKRELAEEGLEGFYRAYGELVALDTTLVSLVLVDTEGNVLGQGNRPSGINMADRPYFRHHEGSRDGQVLVSAPVMGRITGDYIIPVSLRREGRDGAFHGILLAGISPRYFTNFYRQMNLGPQGLVLLVGLDGISRARQAGAQVTSGDRMGDSTLLREAAMRPQGGFVSRGRMDQVPRFLSYRSVPGYDLVVAVGTGVEATLAGAAMRAGHYYAAAAGATLLIVLLGAGLLFVMRRESLALVRSREQAVALERIASAPELESGDLRALAPRVTEAAARAAGAARANLWLFNDDETELRCIDHFDARSGEHTAGMVLRQAQFANEFAVLKHADYVDAHDALGDPRTAGYVEAYLKPNGITSMLDVVISISGRHLGLLCIEHVGRRHRWEPDEIAFACRLADKVAAALANRDRRDAQKALKASHELLSTAERIAGIGGWEWDAATDAVVWSGEFYRIMGLPESHVPTQADFLSRIHPEDIAGVRAAVAGLDEGEREYDVRCRIRRPDASERIVRLQGVATAQGGRVVRMRGTIHDITQSVLAEPRARASEERFRRYFQLGVVGMAITGPDKRFLEVNEELCGMLGRSREELLACTWAQLTHPGDLRADEAQFERMLAGDIDAYSLEKRWIRKDGRSMSAVLSARAVRNGGRALDYVVALVQDITERKEAQEKLVRQAHYDQLTGLPNRVLYFDRLSQALAQAARRRWSAGVLFLDLDRFKTVNETLGHTAGDELLRQAAARLQGCVRSGDTVARVGGDEFGIVLAEVAVPQDAGMVAQKIIDAMAKPFVFDGHEVFVTASVGIAAHPADGRDPETLVKNADAALFQAKREGRNNFKFYAAAMNARAMEKLLMAGELRRALERREFELHYQPKASLVDGSTTGFEALLRWRRADGKAVSPGVFVPVLEDTGLIVPVGDWIVDAACAQLAAWRDAGLALVPVSVNLAAKQFLHHDIAAVVEAALGRHGLRGALLEMEITESDAMQSPEQAAAAMERLKASGVRISIDDFGTGYSSLGYLKRFPLDTLKIDQSFVRGLPADRDDASISLAVIGMAHSLGLEVVAEGVETAEQRAFLAAHGCNQMQGYLLSRPLPAAECAAFLSAPAGLRVVGGAGREVA